MRVPLIENGRDRGHEPPARAMRPIGAPAAKRPFMRERRGQTLLGLGPPRAKHRPTSRLVSSDTSTSSCPDVFYDR